MGFHMKLPRRKREMTLFIGVISIARFVMLRLHRHMDDKACQ